MEEKANSRKSPSCWKTCFLVILIAFGLLELSAAILKTNFGSGRLWAFVSPQEGAGLKEGYSDLLPGYEETVWGQTDREGRAVNPRENPGEKSLEEGTERKKEDEKQVKVYIGGDEILFPDAPPLLMDGRVMVPLRPVLESRYVQSRVSWLGKNRQAAIFDQKDRCLLFTADADTYLIVEPSGKQTEIPLDVPAVIRQGRTYLPLRALLETFSYKVEWNGASRRVNIQDTYPSWRKLLPAAEWEAALDAWRRQEEEGCLSCIIQSYLTKEA